MQCIIVAESGSSSVAERQLPKLNVAGSIPVSRSILPIDFINPALLHGAGFKLCQ